MRRDAAHRALAMQPDSAARQARHRPRCLHRRTAARCPAHSATSVRWVRNSDTARPDRTTTQAANKTAKAGRWKAAAAAIPASAAARCRPHWAGEDRRHNPAMNCFLRVPRLSVGTPRRTYRGLKSERSARGRQFPSLRPISDKQPQPLHAKVRVRPERSRDRNPKAQRGRRSQREPDKLHASSAQVRRINLKTLQRIVFQSFLTTLAIAPPVASDTMTRSRIDPQARCVQTAFRRAGRS